MCIGEQDWFYPASLVLLCVCVMTCVSEMLSLGAAINSQTGKTLPAKDSTFNLRIFVEAIGYLHIIQIQDKFRHEFGIQKKYMCMPELSLYSILNIFLI